MPTFRLGSKDVISQTDTNQPIIAGNVQFPAGHVLQMLHGYYDTPTTIGNTFTKIIELTGTAKGNNSKFIAHWILVAGGYVDSHGHHLRIYLQSGNTSTNTYQSGQGAPGLMQSAGTSTTQSSAYTYYEDVPGTADGDGINGQYSIRTMSGTTVKTMNFGTGDSFAAGFWVRGDSTLYINRSQNRGTHESGISSLILYEIAA